MKINDKALARWRAQLRAMRTDEAFRRSRSARNKKRESSRPQIAALIRGSATVEALWQVFDTRTRTDWDVHGMKG